MSLSLNRKAVIFIRAVAVLGSVAVLLALPIAASATDATDLLVVNGPLANSTVSGTIITNWRNYDNNQSNIAYELTLRDSQTCNNLFGTISVGTKPSSSGTDATVQWPSAGPLNDKASVPDGKYCMVLCVSLKHDDNSNYSACAQRDITIRNTNIPPQIVSSPPANRTFNVNQSFQYQVQATDANGDSLTYSLLNNPAFLTINSTTGYISTNSAAKTPATYDVTVVVRDAYGGTASQQFQLNVIAAPATPPASPPPVTPPTTPPVTPPATGNQPGSINIQFPVADSELKGATNAISWTAVDPDGIKTITVTYSTDKTNWLPVATVAGDKSGYIWNVAQIADGEYYLQVTITDNLGASTSAVSEKFSIANQQQPIDPNATKPLIVSVKPEDSSSITEVRPEISGQFTPPVGGKIDATSFVIKLDDVDISSTCTVTVNDFKCTPAADLALGVHKLDAQVKSDDGQTALRNWSFTVMAKPATAPPASSGSQVSSNTVVIVVLGLCLLALLLFIPWLLFMLWRRRRDQQNAEVYAEPQPVNPAEFTNYEDYLNAATQPAPLPEITTNYYTPQPVAAPAPTITASHPVILTNSTPAPAAPPVDANAYVTTPDFMNYYTTPTTTGLENADSNAPDWLKSSEVETTTSGAPVPLTPSVDEYVAPAAVAATPEHLPGTTFQPVVEPAVPASADFNPLPEASEPVPAVTDTTAAPTTPAVPTAPLAPADFSATPTPLAGEESDGTYGYGRQVDSF